MKPTAQPHHESTWLKIIGSPRARTAKDLLSQTGMSRGKHRSYPRRDGSGVGAGRLELLSAKALSTCVGLHVYTSCSPAE